MTAVILEKGKKEESELRSRTRRRKKEEKSSPNGLGQSVTERKESRSDLVCKSLEENKGGSPVQHRHQTVSQELLRAEEDEKKGRSQLRSPLQG